MPTRYSKSFARVENPYFLLALNVFLEAFRNIECYFNRIGTIEERIEGRRSIRWIRKMEGDFRILAVASGESLERFHDMCIERVNQIKREAYLRNEDERLKLEEQIKSGEIG